MKLYGKILANKFLFSTFAPQNKLTKLYNLSGRELGACQKGVNA